MSDRCSCTPHWQDAGGRHTEYVPEREPTCPAHGDVDALIAVGEYVDRRGQKWRVLWNPDHRTERWLDTSEGQVLTPAQMRLRIVREQHREMCPGLGECEPHPAPLVWRHHRGAWIFGSGWDTYQFATFAEAIDAAQQLAKETP